MVFLSLTGAFALASLAVAVRAPGAGPTWSAVLRGTLALVRNLPATPRFLATPPASSGKGNGWQPVLVGIGVTVVLLAVFGGLLAGADPVFAEILSVYFEDLPFRFVMFVLSVLVTGAAALAALRPVTAVPADPGGQAADKGQRKSGNPEPAVSAAVWTIPLGSLNLLFLAFLSIQATVLFGGADYVQRTTDLTYAEYARQGFFQLLTVSFLVLAVIAAACRFLRSERAGRRRLRNALLGGLCFLTLLLLVSAMYRLGLYSDEFGLTRMRVMAEAAIWWIGAVFVLVLAAGAMDTFGGRTRWLPRTAVMLTGVGLALFAYSNPELRIAESQLNKPADEIDIAYLDDLSADAVPVLLQAVDEVDCLYIPPWYQEEVREQLDQDTPWTAWNASRQRADALLAEMLDASVPDGSPSTTEDPACPAPIPVSFAHR